MTLVIARRGTSGSAPRNRPAAVQPVLDRGAHRIEPDVRRTAVTDGPALPAEAP